MIPYDIQIIDVLGVQRILVRFPEETEQPIGGWWLVESIYHPADGHPPEVTLVAPGHGLMVYTQWQARVWFDVEVKTIAGQKQLTVAWTWGVPTPVPVSVLGTVGLLYGDGQRTVKL